MMNRIRMQKNKSTNRLFTPEEKMRILEWVFLQARCPEPSHREAHYPTASA